MKVSLRLRNRHFTHFGLGGERGREREGERERHYCCFLHRSNTQNTSKIRDVQISLTFRRRKNEINIQLCVYLQYFTIRTTNKNERFWFVQAFSFF